MNYLRIDSIFASKRNGYCVVEFDNGVSHQFSLDIVARYKLRKGLELPQNVFDEISKEQRLIDAKNFALNYVSYKRRTKQQVVSRMRQKKFTEEEISQAIKFLDEFGYLDDKSFIVSYYNYALSQKKHSIKRIRQDLLRKGVDKDLIEEVQKEINIENIEYENALKIAEKKIEQLTKQNKSKIIERLAQHLFAKGFSWEIINSVCDFYRTRGVGH
ncbi:MAG: regulatory protein RecX [Candidatus Kapaibacteriota bacterium]